MYYDIQVTVTSKLKEVMHYYKLSFIQLIFAFHVFGYSYSSQIEFNQPKIGIPLT
jgi:hypothetical protein